MRFLLSFILSFMFVSDALAAMTDVPALLFPSICADQKLSRTYLYIDDGTSYNTKVSFTFQYPKTGNVSKVYFAVSTVTTGGTLQASLQDPDTTTAGYPPDGTADQSGTVAVADTDDNKIMTVTLGSTRSVTRGDWGCLVIEWSGTAGVLQIRVASSSSPVVGYGSSNTYAGSAWTYNANIPTMLLEYDDGSIPQILGTALPQAYALTAFNSSDTPDEIGNKITMPFNATAMGVYVMTDNNNNGFDLVVYDSSGTALRTISLDGNEDGNSYDFNRMYYFSSDLSLSKDSVYRVVLKPGASDVSLYMYDYYPSNLTSSLLKGSLGGDFTIRTDRTDSGSWTDADTKQCAIGFILNQIDDGSGSGTSGGATSYGFFR